MRFDTGRVTRKVSYVLFLCIEYVHCMCIHKERNKPLRDEDQLVYKRF